MSIGTRSGDPLNPGTYTSHGLMSAADLAEYRRDTDWHELHRPLVDPGEVCGVIVAPGRMCGKTPGHDETGEPHGDWAEIDGPTGDAA